jgi:hypothetical protein
LKRIDSKFLEMDEIDLENISSRKSKRASCKNRMINEC